MSNFEVWNLNENVSKYEEYIKKCFTYTPYHLSEFLLAEEMAEDGIIKVFLYEEENQFALFPMVNRKINRLFYAFIKEDDIYDMITPHEYGGVLSNSHKCWIKKKLLEKVLDYCRENQIIFHFIRINPYLSDLPAVFRDCNYEVLFSCNQVCIDLKQTEEDIIKDYKSNVRRNIRRARYEHLQFEISDKTEENIEIFSTIYKKSMDLLQAKKFFYFNKKYFRKLIACECSRLCLVKDSDGNTLAASILLLGENIVYYHLGCFDRNYTLKRPMNYLMHSMILWGKKMGYETFHLGGGGKSLLQFKEGYSNNRIEYYIANKKCDENKYNIICERWKKQFPQYVEEQFYPLYRYNE